MISQLRIENLGVISAADIDLGGGLTVVTGETGAGKTMFVTALDMLTGARAEPRVVRAGAERAIVEGIFELADQIPEVREQIVTRIDDAGGEADDEAILTRSIPADGRARATAGGRTVPLAVLKDVGASLVSMHGQSEQITLRSAARQRELLDRYGGAPIAEALASYQQAHARCTELEAEAARLRDTAAERAARMSYLTESLEAIDAVRPIAGEDEELRALAARLGAAEDLKSAVSTAHDALAGSDWQETPNALDALEQAIAEVTRAAGTDGTLDTHVEALTDVRVRLTDTATELSAYVASFTDLEGQSLDETEARRAALGSLSAYGETVEEVLAFETRAGAELLELQNAESASHGIDDALAAAREAQAATGEQLMTARRAAAAEFAAAVSAELAALSMPRARIVFDITEAAPHSLGTDAVSMLFSAHDAAAPGEIGKLASGGELSRVMLAIEVVKAAKDTFPTFVFDEVDAGVGGKAAIEIGRRLARLAAHSQVIVVTHLAQVAAWADTHITVVKDDAGAGAVSGVRVLDRAGREEELARMLGGMADSGSARAHAVELMDTAAEAKAQF